MTRIEIMDIREILLYLPKYQRLEILLSLIPRYRKIVVVTANERCARCTIHHSYMNNTIKITYNGQSLYYLICNQLVSRAVYRQLVRENDIQIAKREKSAINSYWINWHP